MLAPSIRIPVLKQTLAVAALVLLPLATSVPPALKAPALAAGVAPSTDVAMTGLRKAQSEAFVENRGQWDAQAQFLARSPGVDTWVTERGVVYDFHERTVQGSGDRVRGDEPSQRSTPNAQRPSKRRGHVVRMEFVGGKPSPTRGEGLLEGRYNYFIGSDESKWASNVPRYSEVRSEQVYDGIEARWYFDQGKPRYDLIVAPGVDPGKIQMRFEGAKALSTDGKNLAIETSLGQARHTSLFAYQKVEGATRQVPCSFSVRGQTAAFEVGDYDPTRPLVIDPLVWSTFLGGALSDYARSVALDGSGNAVVAGFTGSVGFPVTAGAYDLTHNGGDDAFISKLSADGSSLIYCTFLGGTASDVAYAVALDTSGNAIVSGYTGSSDLPTTAGAYDQTYNGGFDVFVSKLSTDGASLVYSTFLGGSNFELAYGIALDSSGNAILGGYTTSADLPTTAGAYDQTHNGGNDAYVSKLSADGSSLLYSSFLGGANHDYANSIDIDASGNAVVVGTTNSAGFPTTAGAYDLVHNGGDDGFVSKLSADGASLSYSTFLGGTGSDAAFSVALDNSGSAVVSGYTGSIGFPTTVGAFDQSHNGTDDAFVSKLSADGSSLQYSTYLGGATNDSGRAVALDASGNAFVAGLTSSSAFPVTVGGQDTTYNGGNDAFVAKLSADGTSLSYSTFLGGTGSDQAYAAALDALGNTVVAGITDSTDFPTTVGAHDQSHNGFVDGFVSLVATEPMLMDASVPKNTFLGGFSVPMTVSLYGPAPGDVVVALSTNNPGKVFVSQTKVKAGKSVKTLGVRTETVTADTPVSVTATLNGASKTVNFTLKPGGLQSVKIGQPSLSSLQIGYGRVNLSALAPSGGRRVELDSSRPDLVYVPVSVDVEAGFDNAGFPIFAMPITSSTSVTVTARLGTMKKTATMTVNP